VVGPGAIVLGASIGSGEWLIRPAAVVKYGLSLLWVTTLAVLFQTIFNTEVVRYTLYTGEPAFTGFMRTRPARASGPGPTRSCTSSRTGGRAGRPRPRARSSSWGRAARPRLGRALGCTSSAWARTCCAC
jgi:hypothetical protein